MGAPYDEWVDVVDDHDRVVATVTRARMRASRLQHRAVFVMIVDAADRVLVHRRSDAKDLWPGWWDLAVGGVVGAGESYEAAAVRELLEEVGLRALPDHVGGGRYVDDDVALIGRCYLVRHDPAVHGGVVASDGEVVQWEWVSLLELPRLLAERRFLPDSVALFHDVLFPPDGSTRPL
jgi:8-oxo-dGTP pyrophosphatase MutT (NUDIX family)